MEDGDGLPGDKSGLPGGHEVEETPPKEAGNKVRGEDPEDRLGDEKYQDWEERGTFYGAVNYELKQITASNISKLESIIFFSG